MNDSLKLANLFSRFPQFEDAGKHHYLTWRSHWELYENMQRFLASYKNPSEDRCARYFLQVLQKAIEPEHQNDLTYAREHLTSYLCRTSSIVAKRLHQTYRRIEFFQHRYDERDYLQIAIQYANDPLKLLNGFDFQRQHTDGQLYFIKTFAKAVLERKVKDELYKYNQESILGKYKDWGILRYDTTFKELKIALRSYVEEAKIEQYLYVWHWFKEICKPNRQRSDRASPPPTSQELQNLTRLYQDRYSFLASSGVIVNAKQIEEMLQTCIRAMQSHRNLKLYYPDGILHFENDRDRWDEVFMHEHEVWENAPLNSLARDEEHNEIAELIQTSFDSLSSENKTLLVLWKGLNLSGTRIGLVIDLPQYTVSRRLKKARQLMLKEFSKRMQQHFNDCNLDSAIIDCAKEQMEEVFAKQARVFFKSLLSQYERDRLPLKKWFLQVISQTLNLPYKNLSRITNDIDIFLQENVD